MNSNANIKTALDRAFEYCFKGAELELAPSNYEIFSIDSLPEDPAKLGKKLRDGVKLFILIPFPVSCLNDPEWREKRWILNSESIFVLPIPFKLGDGLDMRHQISIQKKTDTLSQNTFRLEYALHRRRARMVYPSDRHTAQIAWLKKLYDHYSKIVFDSFKSEENWFKPSLLLCDDQEDDIAVKIIRKIGKKLSWNVKFKSNTKKLTFDPDKYDLVLQDIIDKSPNKDVKASGIFSTLSKWKPSKTPGGFPWVIMLSAAYGTSFQSQAYARGADAFLSKDEICVLDDEDIRKRLVELIVASCVFNHWWPDAISNFNELNTKPVGYESALYRLRNRHLDFLLDDGTPEEFEHLGRDQIALKYILWKALKSPSLYTIDPLRLSGKQSLTLLCKRTDGDKSPEIIIKIAPYSMILREYLNYKNIFYPVLRRTIPQLRDIIHICRLGALVYEYIAEDHAEHDAHNMHDLVRSSMPQATLAIDSLFSALKKLHDPNSKINDAKSFIRFFERRVPPYIDIDFSAVKVKVGLDKPEVTFVVSLFAKDRVVLESNTYSRKIKLKKNGKSNEFPDFINHILLRDGRKIDNIVIPADKLSQLDDIVHPNIKDLTWIQEHVKHTGLSAKYKTCFISNCKLFTSDSSIAWRVARDINKMFGKPKWSAIHGDLHMGNILPRRRNDYFDCHILDFYHSEKMGPVAWDYSTLEWDIRTHHISERWAVLAGGKNANDWEDPYKLRRNMDYMEESLSKRTFRCEGESQVPEAASWPIQDDRLCHLYQLLTSIRQKAWMVGVRRLEYSIACFFNILRSLEYPDMIDPVKTVGAPMPLIYLLHWGDKIIGDVSREEYDLKVISEALEVSKKYTEDLPVVGACFIDEEGGTKILSSKKQGETKDLKISHIHAEQALFESLKKRNITSGGTIYSTLEPCCYRTPKHRENLCCADLVIKHKPKRIVIGRLDPNPQIRGRGARLMAENGIEVTIIDSCKFSEAWLQLKGKYNREEITHQVWEKKMER